MQPARIRATTEADLAALVRVQEEGSVVALAHLFPQDAHPFPRAAILARWAAELDDPGIAAYVSTDESGAITGFAALRDDELLHFGTALPQWGTGLATRLHEALLATYPDDVDRLWLRVFVDNHRARRFWEKCGWRSTERTSRSDFAPHPLLVEYELLTACRPGAG